LAFCLFADSQPAYRPLFKRLAIHTIQYKLGCAFCYTYFQ